jgi:hypothetical protein
MSAMFLPSPTGFRVEAFVRLGEDPKPHPWLTH